MASFPLTARASFKGAFTIETVFGVLTTLLQARKVLAGGFDPLKTSVVAGQGYVILNANQAGETFGFGSQLHRMAIYHFKGSGGSIPTIMVPLPAAAGGTAAQKTVTFATVATGSGTFVFRVGSYLTEDVISIAVATGDDPNDDTATLFAAAVNNNENLPYTASAPAAGVVTLTAKTADITSDSLSVTVNQKEDEAGAAPTGMTVAIAASVSGVGTSALTGLTAYIAAESSPWITSIVHPYTDTTSLDTLSTAIGNPNDQTGQYDPRDYRPGSVWTCDTTAGDAGLTAALAVGSARKLDCANIRLEAPDYPELGYEISAYVSGVIENASMSRTASGYTRLNLSELYGPLDPANDWTTFKSGGKSYDNRDLAVQGGLTPIIYKDGIAKPGDVTGFWRPADNQNAPFKYQVNRWKIWQLQNAYNIYLNGADNLDRPIVNSVAAVKQEEKAIDEDVITSGLAQVSGVGARYAWLYSAEFTIKNTTVTPSDVNPDRFNIKLPMVISGNNRINLAELQVDRDPSVITLTLVA